MTLVIKDVTDCNPSATGCILSKEKAERFAQTRTRIRSKVTLRMPTKNQIRFVQTIGAVLDREVELLRELVDRTLDYVTRKPQQALGEMQLRRSA